MKKLSNITQFVICSLIACLFVGKAMAANQIKSVRVWPAPENTRVVFDLAETPEFTYFTLKGPNRLVIDFKDSKNAINFAKVTQKDPRVKRIRTSKAKHKNGTRLVLELVGQYKTSIFPLSPAGQYGHRLVVDLYDKVKAQPPKTVVSIPSPNTSRDVVIGIDAGHGGEDPGSIGPKGTYEKRVTLAIAKKLQKLISKEKGMKAIMIRSGDYYVPVGRRSEIARRKQVDFLVSIHADAFYTPQPKGASVWVVTNKRVESELAKWLMNREKNSELLGGGGGVIKNTTDDNLAITLADMNKEHSLEVSMGIAHNVQSQLKKVTKMHKKRPQSGNFGVLKSSDIPSMLVETGFISNPQEERNLKNSGHQQRLANAIFNGIKGHFTAYPPMGSYYAKVGFKKHKVSRGESLSVLAQKYNVSVGKLKSYNNLSNNTVFVGQTLKIPRAE